MRLTRGAAWLIGVELGALVLFLLAGRAAQARLVEWLVLTPGSLAAGQVWKLVTTSVMNVDAFGRVRMLPLIFDALMLWMFVPVLESWWGTRRFLGFVVASCVVGNLAAGLVGLIAGQAGAFTGLSPAIFGAVAAFGVVFANQPVQLFAIIPIRGRSLAIGMAVFVLVWTVVDGAWMHAAGYLAAMGLAVILTRGAGAAWQPNVWWLKLRRWRLRRRYRVIDGGQGKRWMN